MSVSMTRGDGVTVLTLTSDPQSTCPPLCQIFKTLCYSPVCCSVSQKLKKVQGASLYVLGALHIMVGLLNIGCGSILLSNGRASSWEMDESKYPLWIGALFILFGITCILSEKYPSPCLVIVNVILNLAGIAFAIAAIVLYAIYMAQGRLWWMCKDYDYDYKHATTSSPISNRMHYQCLEAKGLLVVLLRCFGGLLVVLSVLELCITISSATLGIKALKNKDKTESELLFQFLTI
uniref:Transmembrane protein 176B-like n=1 Tax=Echeneis naucrates TaxID=173247 RepID=A0A665UDQ6_ECHNA